MNFFDIKKGNKRELPCEVLGQEGIYVKLKELFFGDVGTVKAATGKKYAIGQKVSVFVDPESFNAGSWIK